MSPGSPICAGLSQVRLPVGDQSLTSRWNPTKQPAEKWNLGSGSEVPGPYTTCLTSYFPCWELSLDTKNALVKLCSFPRALSSTELASCGDSEMHSVPTDFITLPLPFLWKCGKMHLLTRWFVLMPNNSLGNWFNCSKLAYQWFWKSYNSILQIFFTQTASPQTNVRALREDEFFCLLI